MYAIDEASTRRDDCDAAQCDGAELAAAALDVARVADERLAAALAAADVGAVHADDVVAALVAAAERGPVWISTSTPSRADAVDFDAEHGRETVAHPARRDGLLGCLGERR